MSTNLLTERLLAEGYTPDNHPDYVEWHCGWRCFEYTRNFLANTVWETPCGLLMKGIHSYNHSSFGGIDYCPENNNPLFGCPYFDETPCPHRLENRLWGHNCVYHMTDGPYNYELSVERIWDYWDKIECQARQELEGYCACMEWDRPNRRFVPKFNVETCMQSNCTNETCFVTKRPRNLERVNIYVDIVRVKRYKRKGALFEHEEKTIQKGIKVLKKPAARTDAEIWLRQNRKSVLSPGRWGTEEDSLAAFINDWHNKRDELLAYARQFPAEWFPTYKVELAEQFEWFEFRLSVENIRIERREVRDLIQDLRDAAEGFEVVHASDIERARKQAKRERRQKYLEQKAKRRKKRKAAESFEQRGLFKAGA